MSKIVKYLLYILLAVSVVFIIAFFINQDAALDAFLYYTYALVGIAIIAAIGLPLIHMISNPKGLKKMMISLGLVVAFVALAYMLSSSEPLAVKINMEPSAQTLKLTDTGLILTYILAAVAFISILSGGIIKLVKNR
ncbi:MAG: hypothetical protein ACD_77C00440G0003 [uncultured bacterium]|nr:MAG: hypothetical protein ACD_77C00440G0003 [uncultured bacterium]HBY01780.1 hypothetical protein [Rikenellaceae bacterium]